MKKPYWKTDMVEPACAVCTVLAFNSSILKVVFLYGEGIFFHLY